MVVFPCGKPCATYFIFLSQRTIFTLCCFCCIKLGPIQKKNISRNPCKELLKCIDFFCQARGKGLVFIVHKGLKRHQCSKCNKMRISHVFCDQGKYLIIGSSSSLQLFVRLCYCVMVLTVCYVSRNLKTFSFRKKNIILSEHFTTIVEK